MHAALGMRSSWLLSAILFLSCAGHYGPSPAAAALAPPCGRAGQQPCAQPPSAPGRVLVQFAEPSGDDAVAASAAVLSSLPGLEVAEVIGARRAPSGASVAASSAAIQPRRRRVVAFKITDAKSVAQKVAELKSHPQIHSVEPDYAYHVGRLAPLDGGAARRRLSAAATASGSVRRSARLPNDARFKPGLRSSGQWQLMQIGVPTAWGLSTGSKKVGVCVIDTGARATHVDLRGNIVDGWNRALEAGQYDMPAAGTPEYKDFSDDHGHGSNVAGILAASGNNVAGISGAAWSASLYICKAGNSQGMMYSSGVLDCFTLCQEAGARVISASFGGGEYSELQEAALADLAAAGVVVVTAAGNNAGNNDANPFYPASYGAPTQIVVGASQADGKPAMFTNFGRTSVHLFAPGVNVWGAAKDSDSGFKYNSGTSQATPLVSAAAALLFAAKPTATAAEVRSAILSSVDKLTALAGKATSAGRLNTGKALAKLLGVPLPAQPPAIQWSWLVEKGLQYRINLVCEGYEVLTTSPDNCMASCESKGWCHYAVAYTSRMQFPVWNTQPFPTGNCLHVDMSAVVVGVDRVAGAVSGYRKGSWLAASPPPSPHPAAGIPPIKRTAG